MSPGHAVPKKNHDLNVDPLTRPRGGREAAGGRDTAMALRPGLRLLVLSLVLMLTGGGDPAPFPIGT